MSNEIFFIWDVDTMCIYADDALRKKILSAVGQSLGRCHEISCNPPEDTHLFICLSEPHTGKSIAARIEQMVKG